MSQQTKEDCTSAHTALSKLQKLVVKLRCFTVIRESLGTCLHVPGDTRWTAKLNMTSCSLDSEETIKAVVRSKKPELLGKVNAMYASYKDILEDYRRVVDPIKKRIKQLEVGFYLYFYT
ncbi:MAG: hypothetical protein SFU27_10645 [Thermonemataceae bacterium]|nr:hypothetical protein [Thermonemataceae bacterium]